MSAHDHPLERLNYRNGQRLEALDYRAEQAYHIAVRRWLNRSLYTSGIAKGLEVTAKTKHTVEVAPGLALDVSGREIILIEPQEVAVVGTPSTTPGVVFGNYLVIEYGEERTAPTHETCGCDLSWGGPTRIRAVPILSFQDSWPAESSGRILLGQVELKQGCEIVRIHTSTRKYVAASKPPRVRALTFEGEKDIDAANPKVLYFSIDGAYPNEATLYLRATQFSTLYYSEIGSHTHNLNITLQDAPAGAAHSHTLGKLTTNEAGGHTHTVEANVEDKGGNNALEMDGKEDRANLTTDVDMTLSEAGKHAHEIAAGNTTDPAGAVAAHNHPFATKSADPFGAQPAARPGPALQFVNDLRVILDGVDITGPLLAQLQGRPGQAANWPALGNGLATHALVTTGTGPIDLIPLGGDLSPGPHTLVLKVAAGGGQIHYTLYVA